MLVKKIRVLMFAVLIANLSIFAVDKYTYEVVTNLSDATVTITSLPFDSSAIWDTKAPVDVYNAPEIRKLIFNCQAVDITYEPVGRSGDFVDS